MEYLKQNYRLTDKDLVENFLVENSLSNYAPLMKLYSPYWVRYEVHRVFRSGDTERYGSMFRLPVKVSTGVYRPNFLIGFDWDTGEYLIRWKFKDSESSEIVVRDKHFVVLTEGIHNTSKELIRSYIDFPIKLTVVD